MAQYPAIYSDRSGSVKTTIFNLFSEKGTECLEMVIEGVAFIASGFDNFTLVNPEKYDDEQLNRFTFNKVPVQGADHFVLELCSCKLDFYIPQFIYDVVHEEEIESGLRVVLYLGTPAKNGGIRSLKANFTLSFSDRKFASQSTDFETALSQMQKEMMPDFRFINCFSCHYSDYSPAGNGFFASMMCFRKNKAAYLTASKKEDFFKLESQGFIAVQETYHCDEFSPREKDTGYRGWPFGE